MLGDRRGEFSGGVVLGLREAHPFAEVGDQVYIDAISDSGE